MKDILIRILERAPEITIAKLTILALVTVLCLIFNIK